ncbi:phosphomevalonate kinase [Rheinheimera pacifica]|uniref:hypothetical protein n=1 Tax=Rheinheimera pacifica TaxID=173990 RepID=UPI002862A3FD|nr:hypothetical protein [Rheinheimera pacifica]MDR6984897.1 phosphomevalonate kinase [Rheinheimera pacifica]
MTPNEIKNRFDDIADRVMILSHELDELTSLLQLSGDRKAVQSIRTDLHWIAENCTVVGLHQVGKALDDDMGMGDV